MSERLRPLGLTGTLAAVVVMTTCPAWLLVVLSDRAPTFNDFHAYWLAGRLLLSGHSPYDLEAMRALGAKEGLDFVLGTGYSYPLPFALLLVPLALVPFTAAAVVFGTGSVVAFGGLVAWWLSRFHAAASRRRLVAAAVLVAAFPPIVGSLAIGQANLFVVLLLAVGLASLVGEMPRPWLGGAAIGLAGVVKLVPLAAAVPLVLGRRWSPAVAIGATFVASILAAIAIAPRASAGTVGLVALLGPDPYFTNQSLNGFLSRLVIDTDRTQAIAPGAFDPLILSAIAAVVFGLMTLRTLARAFRGSSSTRVMAQALALALVAGTIVAPKNSFWNQALVLPCLGLVMALDAPDLRLGRFSRTDKVLLGAFGLGLAAQLPAWLLAPAVAGTFTALANVAQSSGLYGMLALWLLLTLRLRRQVPDPAMAESRLAAVDPELPAPVAAGTPATPRSLVPQAGRSRSVGPV